MPFKSDSARKATFAKKDLEALKKKTGYKQYGLSDVQNKVTKHDVCSNCSHIFDKNGMCPCRKQTLHRLNKDEKLRLERNKKSEWDNSIGEFKPYTMAGNYYGKSE